MSMASIPPGPTMATAICSWTGLVSITTRPRVSTTSRQSERGLKNLLLCPLKSPSIEINLQGFRGHDIIVHFVVFQGGNTCPVPSW